MLHHGVSWAPEIPIVVSLGVIVATLAVTTVWSLHTSRYAKCTSGEIAVLSICCMQSSSGRVAERGLLRRSLFSEPERSVEIGDVAGVL
jgi:hypothetical protein